MKYTKEERKANMYLWLDIVTTKLWNQYHEIINSTKSLESKKAEVEIVLALINYYGTQMHQFYDNLDCRLLDKYAKEYDL